MANIFYDKLKCLSFVASNIYLAKSNLPKGELNAVLGIDDLSKGI